MISFRGQIPSGLWRWLAAATLAASLLFVSAADFGARRADPRSASSQKPQSLAEGRQFFESRCAGCHGLDGRGAERAPDIVTGAARQRSRARLAEIIRQGVPASGMPAFSTLDPISMNALVGYIKFLQGEGGAAAKVSGNAQKGEAIFFGKARCSECHMIAGKGGFIASDLSVFGKSRPPDEIREAIVKPDQTNRRGGVLLVTTRDGSKVSGVLRNEDNFSLQLQALDGSFQLLMKPEIEKVERQPGSLMPADYGSTLSKQELDDLISFLVRAAERDKSPAKKKSHEDDENE
jgi:cytochrome c oxidase cbb3-type subunit III